MIGLNNPFNIRYNGKPWKGLVSQTNGFCNFKSISYSVRLVLYLFLKSYRKYKCFTIKDCLHRFHSLGLYSDRVDFYVVFVCYYSQLDSSRTVASLRFDEWFQLLKAMSIIESDYKLRYNDFNDGFTFFKYEV